MALSSVSGARRGVLIALGVVGSIFSLAGCGSGVFGAAPQKDVAWFTRATPEQIAADPCRYGDLKLCTKQCEDTRDAASCNTVAVMLEWANVDFASAAPFYGRACAAAYAPGCTGLAWLHLLGRGVRKDQALAMKLFTRAFDGYRLACDQGQLDGCVVAADMLIDGLGVDPDEKLAMTLLEDACARGEARACKKARTLHDAMAD